MLRFTLASAATAALGLPSDASALPSEEALAACMAAEPSRAASGEVSVDWVDLESMYDRASVARRYSRGWRVVIADRGGCEHHRLSDRDGRALDHLLARPNLAAELQSANDQRCDVIGYAGAAIEVRTPSQRFKVHANTTCRSAPQADELLRLAGRSGHP